MTGHWKVHLRDTYENGETGDEHAFIADEDDCWFAKEAVEAACQDRFWFEKGVRHFVVTAPDGERVEVEAYTTVAYEFDETGPYAPDDNEGDAS